MKMMGNKVEDRYAKVQTPIWTKEMGRRLSIARMSMGIDQLELSERLGVTQAAISKIELGKVTVTRIPTLAIREAIGKHLTYVLFGSNSSAYDERLIRRKYWALRLTRGGTIFEKHIIEAKKKYAEEAKKC